MTVAGASIGVGCGTSNGCVDKFGCPNNRCPDFTVARHDTKPPFKVNVEDCDGPIDLTNLVLEVSMWAKAKLKADVTSLDTYFRLADDIGFEQIMVGDIIIMDRIRLPEHMRVVAFDETNKLVQVARGVNGSTASDWKKGSAMRIMRVYNAAAQTELILDDIIQADGSTLEDQLIESYLIYEWSPEDTCLPGCYWLEYKLLKMEDSASMAALQVSSDPIVPSFTDPSLTPTDFGCKLGEGVEWVRRFPVEDEGFLIKITNSPTAEL